MTAVAHRQSQSSSLHLYPPKAALTAATGLLNQAKVPHIPDVVLALRTEMNRPEPDLRVASDLILQDAAITGDLLKAINSPVFNLRSKVTSVPQAAAMMGVKRLTNYLTAAALTRMVEGMDARVRGVWEDIMEGARMIVAAARLTRTTGDDEAYLFAIMHDVGSLIFASQSGDYISQWALRSGSEPSLLIDYERRTAGADHGAVGFMLAANWKLPEYLALAICHHHTPGFVEADDPRVNQLIALAKLGQYLIALSRGTHELPEMQSYLEDAWHDLEIGDAEWSALCERVQTGDLRR